MKEVPDSRSVNIQPGYLKREQIARFLGVSVKTISKIIRQRRIPFIKFWGTERFDPVKVRKALEKYGIQEI